MDQIEQDISTWGETTNDNGDETNAKYPALHFYKYAWNLIKRPRLCPPSYSFILAITRRNTDSSP